MRYAMLVALAWITVQSATLQSCPAAGPDQFAPDAAGTPDRAAVLRDLQDFSLAGMDRRLGPDYAACHRGGPAEKFPTVWMAPRRQDHGGREYQIGGPWVKEAGDFSSTQGQVLYVPDAGFFPVDRVTIIEWSNGCFTEAPLAPWHGGFRPEPASARWKQALPGGAVGLPIAMARGMGYWANNGLAIFSSGLVAAAGTVTARGLEPTLRLPPHKLPTAISLTNKSEFALITVCDIRGAQRPGCRAVDARGRAEDPLRPRVAGRPRLVAAQRGGLHGDETAGLRRPAGDRVSDGRVRRGQRLGRPHERPRRQRRSAARVRSGPAGRSRRVPEGLERPLRRATPDLPS